MLHKTLKATTTAQDQGHFTALAATYSVDRVNDRIVPGAFAKTIEAWKSSGKMLPVHWNHADTAADVIGFVDPATMAETKDGLYVEGQLDISESDVAKEAWRSMKNNAVALSFGYMTTKNRKAKDGVNELLELDLFEVSIVPGPANPGTRLLSLKSAAAVVEGPEEDTELKPEFPDIEAVKAFVAEKFPEFEVTPVSKGKSEDPLRKRTFDLALEASGGDPNAHVVEPEPEPQPEPHNEAELRRLSERAALDIALG